MVIIYGHSMFEMHKDFSKIIKIARGSKFQRFLNRPFNYLWGILFTKFIYPKNLKEYRVQTKTFFGESLQINLPAGLDIFITGAKTHHSELRLIDFLLKNIKPNDTFIDIGAHFGFYSTLASKLVAKNGRVISFEASPNVFKVLEKNTEAKKNIEIYALACSNNVGKVEFYDFPALYSEFNSLNRNQYNNETWIKKYKPQKIEVDCITLDSFSLKPNFVKIDVEGAEHLVVKGMINTLKENPKMLIALEYLVKPKNQNYRDATKLLVELGFLPHLILKDGKLQAISPLEIEDYLKSHKIDSDNILFKKINIASKNMA